MTISDKEFIWPTSTSKNLLKGKASLRLPTIRYTFMLHVIQLLPYLKTATNSKVYVGKATLQLTMFLTLDTNEDLS